jgi:hypothetical protein
MLHNNIKNLTIFQNTMLKEIILLTIVFTLLAVYFDIHEEQHVLMFTRNHVIALLLALSLSKIIHISSNLTYKN